MKPSLRAASCCSVEVVNGGAGMRRSGFFATELTRKVASLQLSRKASTLALCALNRVSSSAFTSVAEPSAAVRANTAATR